MFVLITYDVNVTSPSGAKRLRNVARACQNYGHRVQNSVFECLVSESQLLLLKEQLNAIIEKSNDSIRIYNLGAKWLQKVETLGQNKSINFAGELII